MHSPLVILRRRSERSAGRKRASSEASNFAHRRAKRLDLRGGYSAVNEHQFDRLARRVAVADRDLSRRRFLVSSAALVVSTALPLRLAGVAVATSTTSCSCQAFADRVYLDCWNEYVDSAGPFNDGSGALAALQFGITNRGGEYVCLPKADQAQTSCRQVPCPAGQSCVTPPRGEPTCQDPCQNRCAGTQTCCNGQCAELSSDSSNCGTCGRACVPPSKCCNGHCSTGKCLDCAQQQQQGTNGAPPGVAKWFKNCYLPTRPAGCQCVQVCSDANNCGSCGHVCGAQGGTTGRCVDGKCVYDTTSYGFCTEDPNNIWTNNAGTVPGKEC